MLLQMDGYDVIYWHFIWSLCMPVAQCEVCKGELQQVAQGLTNYEWYKDYYCPSCKRTIVKLDKDQNRNLRRLTDERMF